MTTITHNKLHRVLFFIIVFRDTCLQRGIVFICLKINIS